VQGAIHGFDADSTPALRDPSLDPIDQARVGLGLGMPSEPLQVDHTRIISPARLELNIAGVSVPSENATDRCTADPEHLCRRVVGLS